METLFNTKRSNPFEEAIEPFKEIAAYEAIWTEHNMSFPKISQKFSLEPFAKASDLVEGQKMNSIQERIINDILPKFDNIHDKVGVLFASTFDYPSRLLDAKEPVRLLYFKGDLSLLDNKCIAVVGSRNVSEEGKKRTQILVRKLVEDGFTIVSGLAKGVDKTAHEEAIRLNGKTIAVIGTPIDQYYPPENRSLQDLIAKEHLVISQVPFVRYSEQNPKTNRFFFPERNKTMSALTLATIIVEASDTSGTLTQARAALFQKRKLFILNSCFENENISWPQRFEKEGAIRVYTYNDIKSNLGNV